MKLQILSALFISLAGSAFAAPLSDYTKVGSTVKISTLEASAIAYNRDTGLLYTIGDEGGYIQTHTTAGVNIANQRMGLGSFQDPEGLAYIGNGKFILTEERKQIAHEFTYIPQPTVGAGPGDTIEYHFGEFVSNIGLEGVSYDRLTNTLWGVKEKSPQLVYQMTNLGGANTVTTPFDSAPFGLLDYGDIYLLSNSNAFTGTSREWNILLLSQESSRIIEVTRTGELVSSLDLTNLGEGYSSIEGLTMDDNGTLYLVGEGLGSSSESNLFILSAVPEPSTYVLLAIGALGLLAFSRRERKIAT